MAFDLYFAGSQHKDIDVHIKKNRCCRLFSQLNERKAVLDYAAETERGKLFIDSGAFSVAHAGKTVDIDEYIAFINEHPEIEVWAQLDVIPYPVLDTETAYECSEASWKNYLYMMERITVDKDKLLPIYHFGEPISHLERILNTKVDGKVPDYIGVGGRHGVSTAQHVAYFDNLFKIVKRSDNPNVKIHAFGMTVLSLLEQFPFYSADSTTWLMIGANGGIMDKKYNVVNISERQKNNKDNFVNYPEEAKRYLYKQFEHFGYTYEQLATDYRERMKYNIDYLLEWAHNYQYKPKHLGLCKLF